MKVIITSICIVRVCVMMFLFACDSSSTDVKHRVARSLPLSDVGLNRAPFYDILSNSKVKCLSECMQKNCASFNYGGGQCELLDTYLCEGIETLTNRVGFQHYDVEIGDMILVADVYRNETGCVTSGICSPKCYPLTTTTMAPATTTTMAPATTTTMAPATTTTMAPATTTTMPAATTTTIPPATTTTMAPATTTTMPSAPGPGEVNYSCSSDLDCTTVNSNCRNYVVCECVAGYSYDSASKTCSTTCPGGYGNTFTLTIGFYVYGYDISISYVDSDTCATDCIADPTCLSFQYDLMLAECHLSYVTKAGYEGSWWEDSFYDYYQRNCL